MEESTMPPQALEGLKVIELSCLDSIPYFAATIAGKIFADLGAEVIKVEPPGAGAIERIRGPFCGDPASGETSALHLYLNANKFGITLDVEDPRHRDLLMRLLGSADIVFNPNLPILSERLGLDWRTLTTQFPRLIVVSTPFFPSGSAYENVRGGDLIANHMSVVGWTTPGLQILDPARQPPLKPAGRQTDYQTGWTAATAALCAVIDRERTGAGQHIEVSQWLSTVSTVRPEIGIIGHESADSPSYQRIMTRRKTGMIWVYRCTDGWINFAGPGERQWPRIKKMLGDPEWTDGELFATALARLENSDALEAALSEWMAGRPRDEAFKMAQEAHLPCFPVYTPGEIANNEQYAARGFFVDYEHPAAGRVTMPGAPFIMTLTPWRIVRPAPALGEHNRKILGELGLSESESAEVGRSRARGPIWSDAAPTRSTPAPSQAAPGQNLPLAGIRVLDFGWVYSVPHTGAWLGALGAEVIRVESTLSPDNVRTGGAGGAAGFNRSGPFNAINLNKQSIVLNLKSAQGREIARRLALSADIVLENFAVGTMSEFGLSYEDLRRAKPSLIMLSGTCLGQTGPLAHTVGYGPNVQAFGGMSHLTQHPGADYPSGRIGGTYPDFLVGVAMTFALLAALRHRNRTGEGQYIDVSMGETVTAALPEELIDFLINRHEADPMGNRDRHLAPHGVFPADGDERWIAIAVASDQEFVALCEALASPKLALDSRFARMADRLDNVDALEAEIAALTRKFERDDLVTILRARNLAAGPVYNTSELVNDPVLASSGLLVKVAHAECGERIIPGIPARFSAFAPKYSAAPLIGEHSEEVLGRLLGYSDDEVARLRVEKIVI